MDVYIGQRFLFYDGDLDEVVGMFLESCGIEFGVDTFIRESLFVFIIFDVFFDCVLSEEKYECSVVVVGFDKCYYSYFGYKEFFENVKWDMSEAFCKMGNNDNNGELLWLENLVDIIVVQKGLESLFRVRVFKFTLFLIQFEGSVFRFEFGSIFKGCKS